jgi:hypothetical protein
MGVEELDALPRELSANAVVVGHFRGVRVRHSDGRWWIFYTADPGRILGALAAAGVRTTHETETLRRGDVM